MARRNLTKWTSLAGGAALFLLSLPATAAAQCIMCYMSAGSTGERGAHVLRVGILVLAIPTLLTFAGIFLLVYRRRNPAGSAENPIPAGQDDNEDLLLALPGGEPNHSPSAF